MPGMNEWDVSAEQLQKTHGYAARTDYHKDFEQARKAGELAREIMRLARSTLLIHMRFMESALVRLAHGDETVTAEMATDGRFLYYNSLHVCRSFKRESSLPARDYMHLTLHCVFRHMFIGKGVNTDLWDLACDIAAESVINSLNIKALYASRQEKQGWLIRKLRDELPRLTAERIYRWLIDQELPEQIRLHTHSPQFPANEADFLFITDPSQMEAAFSQAKCGTLENPHASATLFIRDTGPETEKLRLSGPGIKDSLECFVSETARRALSLRDAQQYEYPQGVDLVLIKPDGTFFCVPRLVRKEG